MKLLASTISPYAMRVMLAARAKGLDLAIEEPDLHTPQFRAINPIGKIPVLIDGPLVLPESDVILNYLEERYPQPSLLPGSPADRSNARLLVRLIDTYSEPSLSVFFQPEKEPIALALTRIDTSLGYIDHFRKDGAFASGDAFSIADCALIPFFFAFDQLQGGFGTMDLVNKRPKLGAWWKRARNSPLGAYAFDEMSKGLVRFLESQR